MNIVNISSNLYAINQSERMNSCLLESEVPTLQSEGRFTQCAIILLPFHFLEMISLKTCSVKKILHQSCVQPVCRKYTKSNITFDTNKLHERNTLRNFISFALKT